MEPGVLALNVVVLLLAAIWAIAKLQAIRTAAQFKANQQAVIQRSLEVGQARAERRVGFNGPAAIEAWTPAERATLGIDDTDQWIKETELILKQAEWERLTSFDGHDQGEPVIS